MPVITCIEDLKRIYKRRTPKMFYDYCGKRQLYRADLPREYQRTFRKLRLRQKVAVDMTGRTTASTMIGQTVSMPVALAPVGMTGMQHAGWRDKGGARGREIRRALHPVHHVDLFDRGCGGAYHRRRSGSSFMS